MGQLYQAPPPFPPDGLLRSYNPATEQELGTVPIANTEAVKQAVAQARAAQAAWGVLSVAERAQRLKPFRNLVKERAPEICRWISEETGKPLMESLLQEVAVVVDTATYFIKRAPRLLEPTGIPLHLLKNRKSYLHYVPRGVVGIISPWNFPFSIPWVDSLMALLAGNAVVVKPSEITPLVMQKTKELLDQSGVPSELLQVVHGFGETGAALLQSGIDYCIFTGSTAVGRKVAAICGEKLIPCALELGGKAPALVCEDVDITRTARALVWGAFANSGQVCVSIERAYIPKRIYESLCRAIVQETLALRQGNPQATGLELGAMTWGQQRNHVHQMVQRAIAEGALCLTGGTLPTGPGLYYPPTVLGGCTPTMEVVQQEIFGPVLPLVPVANEAEGLQYSNASPFGLMGYVFARDAKRAKTYAEQMRAGTVMCNDSLLSFATPETPWGGLGASGMGRTHGAQGLKDLCQLRHVNRDRIQFSHEPWWFPYKEHWLNKMYAFLRTWFR